MPNVGVHNNLGGSNKTIAKNALYLYFRLFISLLIGLYASRVILKALGAEDYGIYNIVAGFVGMLSLFTVSLSGAVSRFITYELGIGNLKRIKEVFSTITILIVILSLIVIIIGETAGLFFVKKYLVIPKSRLGVAFFCYHFALMTFVTNLISLPYQSIITAHERFSFYSLIDIFQSIFKLVIIWLLNISPYDKLGTYAVLLFIVGLSVPISYISYCYFNYKKEIQLSIQIHKQAFKEILSYSCWITIGASSAIFKEQGVNILINSFFGVIMNAARGISMQVYGLANQFSTSIATAIQPQITKSYAIGDINRSIALTFILAKAKGIMLILISLPIVLEANYLIHVWLLSVPDNTVLFVQWALLLCYSRAIEDTHGPLFLATGKVRNLQIIGGGLMMMNLPISYFLLKSGSPAIITMKVGVILELIVMWVAFMFLKKMVGFPIFKFYKDVVIPQFILIFLVASIALGVQSLMKEPSFCRFVIVSVTSISTTITLTFFYLLNKSEREVLKGFIRKKIYLIYAKFTKNNKV